MQSSASDPFADVLNLEENFHKAGHDHGFEQGKLAGFEEGRQLGVAKGFEIWEEVGFYQGFASLWNEYYLKTGTTESRGSQQASAILELASKFPTSNPKHEDFDVLKLLNQIISKYKVLCATVGTRPRMFVASNDS
ncbi:DUF1715-domain-containing protein [Auricularia subglabra TFB-10046 SS5]|uniref:DUF1715-domain-containing protein n=1 Tax=Auricularia subglabra (strain TFB-10046 / SS5) TaxID=717982 RepID=J0LFH5_AURST|nr:DUF1715-domain-containing protein [Auricularia subglabra TFB-10046 SS5]